MAIFCLPYAIPLNNPRRACPFMGAKKEAWKMQFEIRFEGQETPTNYGIAWRTDSRHVGLEFLDRVRKALGVPNLDPKRVDDYVRDDWARAVSMIITEEEARELGEKYGYFKESSTVRVVVPAKSLTKYAKIAHRVEKNNSTGEIERVTPVWRVEPATVYCDWLAAGAPLEWSPSEEEEGEETS